MPRIAIKALQGVINQKSKELFWCNLLPSVRWNPPVLQGMQQLNLLVLIYLGKCLRIEAGGGLIDSRNSRTVSWP